MIIEGENFHKMETEGGDGGEHVLVTGASGFIASHIVQQLQGQGYRVRGTVRSLQNAIKVEPLRQLCPGAKYPLELVEADLLKPDSWPAAVADCRYVLHVASPSPAELPRDEDELIKPAVEGTLSVLRACHNAGLVKRVVITSSGASVVGSMTKNGEYTEDDWTDPEQISDAYKKSKTLAEKAAWAYHAELAEDTRFELAVVNPFFVMGPVLSGSVCTSMEVPRRLLQHEMPMIPKLIIPSVDVRDVAAAHLAAMKIPEAAGHRHLVCAESFWFLDYAKVLEKEFKPQGYKVPTRVAPYAFLWLVGRFDKTIRMVLPSVGKTIKVDNGRMRNVLGIEPRDIREGLLDMAYSLIDKGFIMKTSKYSGPPSSDPPSSDY